MGHTKLLLVEDNYIVAMEIQQELQERGYNTYKIATTGKKAVEIAKQKSPDAIIMDILLSSDMDGIEAAQKILTEENIPIIFLTGYDSENIRQRAHKLEPAAYIVKPVDVKKIENHLKKILGD